MLPIYICEDMEGELQKLKKIVEKALKSENLSNMKLVCAVNNPDDLIHYLSRHRQQSLYFLDIDLGKGHMNGLELGQEIRNYDPRAFITIVTTHDEMARLTFKYKIEAMDFIEKDGDDMEKRILDCMKKAFALYKSPANTMKKKISFRIGEKTFTIAADEIYCIMTASDKSHKIIIIEQTRRTELASTLVEIEKCLDDSFFKCDKSCIINLNHIAQIDHANRIAILDNGSICKVSIRKMKQLEKKYKEFFKVL